MRALEGARLDSNHPSGPVSRALIAAMVARYQPDNDSQQCKTEIMEAAERAYASALQDLADRHPVRAHTRFFV
jgi:hypothetical protein